MGRRKVRPEYVCSRCRYKTTNISHFIKHVFHNTTPCTVHCEGYLPKNYQIGQIIRVRLRRLQTGKPGERSHQAAYNFFNRMKTEQLSIRMFPEDEKDEILAMIDRSKALCAECSVSVYYEDTKKK